VHAGSDRGVGAGPVEQLAATLELIHRAQMFGACTEQLPEPGEVVTDDRLSWVYDAELLTTDERDLLEVPVWALCDGECEGSPYGDGTSGYFCSYGDGGGDFRAQEKGHGTGCAYGISGYTGSGMGVGICYGVPIVIFSDARFSGPGYTDGFADGVYRRSTRYNAAGTGLKLIKWKLEGKWEEIQIQTQS